MTNTPAYETPEAASVRRTPARRKPFSRLGSRWTCLPTGPTTALVGYVHPTKGVRTRRLTPQLIVALTA